MVSSLLSCGPLYHKCAPIGVLESNSVGFRVLLVTLCRQSVRKSFSTKGLYRLLRKHKISKLSTSYPHSYRTKIKFEVHSAPKRPDVMECEIQHATIKGEKWTILVGLLGGRPYEVLGGLAEFVEIPSKYSNGWIKKRSRKSRNSIYDLIFGENGSEVTIKDVVRVFDNPNYAGFTRMISLALRHGAPPHYVVEQLQKDRDADLFSFAKVVSRVLKNYIKDGTKPGGGVCPGCSEDALTYQEGCVTCLACGYGKCG